ncbi:MAG: hypothetical protein ACJAZO_004841 [Myxococcota bacterium]|jgi:hypothetical protein
MNRRTFLIGTSLLAVVSATPGCALIFDGGKGPDERDYGRLLWGWLILDILFTGLIGVVIDLATGAIYVRRGGATMAGTVAPANLCRDATEMVLTVGRPRRASRYLAGHVPTCLHCSLALADIQDGTVDVAEIMHGDGEFASKPVPVALLDESISA